MSERFTKLFGSSTSLYASDAPVVIKAYALLLDTKTTNVVAQIKYQNVTPYKIIALDVSIDGKDANGEALGAPVTHSYLNLAAAPGADFGVQSAITLSDKNTRSYTPAVTKVYFENGTIWEGGNAEWNALAPTVPISARMESEVALKEYREGVCPNAIVAASCSAELWLCSCGAYNKNGTTNCQACGTSLSAMLSATTESLEKDATYRRACAFLARGKKEDLAEAEKLFCDLVDWRDTEQKLEEVRQKLVKLKKKKRTKRLILFGAIGAAVLAILISILAPAIRYSSACKQWEKGNYEEAIEKIEKCSDSRRLDFYMEYKNEIEDAIIDCIKEDDWYLAGRIFERAQSAILYGYTYDDEALGAVIDLYMTEAVGSQSFTVNMADVISYLDNCSDSSFVKNVTKRCPSIEKVRNLDGNWVSYSGTESYYKNLAIAQYGGLSYRIDDGKVRGNFDTSEDGDRIILYKGSLYIVSTYVAERGNFTLDRSHYYYTEYYDKITSVTSGYMTVHENSLNWTVNYEKK